MLSNAKTYTNLIQPLLSKPFWTSLDLSNPIQTFHQLKGEFCAWDEEYEREKIMSMCYVRELKIRRLMYLQEAQTTADILQRQFARYGDYTGRISQLEQNFDFQ